MKKIIALLLTLSLTLVPGTLVMAEGEEADVPRMAPEAD